MKLDVVGLRYLGKEEFRVLVAIELGMRNHEIVPTPLICSLSKLKRSSTHRSLVEVHKLKLIYHDAKKYDGYKLTYLGYDFLALKAFSARGVVSLVGPKIGVGKESDIYRVSNEADEELVLKLHRLGRVSFRAIKEKRDYLKHRKSASWLYMSRLAALKEYAYMKALHDNGFPVPKPYDVNRHCVVMQFIKATPLCNVDEIRHPAKVYSELMNLIVKLASYGLIHGDFNEFNLLIDDDETITIIDFPQMVSTSHINAKYYFERDVNCIRIFFEKKYKFTSSEYPKFEDYNFNEYNLDVEIQASGFLKEHSVKTDDLVPEIDKKEVEATKDENDDENESDEEDESDSSESEEETEEQIAAWEQRLNSKMRWSAMPSKSAQSYEEPSIEEQHKAREKVLAQLRKDREDAGLSPQTPVEREEKKQKELETLIDAQSKKEEPVGEENEETEAVVDEDSMIREKVKKSLGKKSGGKNGWKRNAVKNSKRKGNSAKAAINNW